MLFSPGKSSLVVMGVVPVPETAPTAVGLPVLPVVVPPVVAVPVAAPPVAPALPGVVAVAVPVLPGTVVLPTPAIVAGGVPAPGVVTVEDEVR
jgi:hypothetical protein